MAKARQAPAAGGRRRRAPARPTARSGWRARIADPPALLLLGVWVDTRLYPFVPSLDPAKYWHAVRPFLENPLPGGGEAFRLCLSWLLAAMLIEAAAGAARARRAFLILAGCVFAARVLIAGTALSGDDIDGALVALALWVLVFRRAPGRYAILAAFFGAMVAAVRLAAPHGATWVPFAALLRGPPGAVVAALLDRTFLFGGLIWLLARAGLRPLSATLVAALLALLTAFSASGTGHAPDLTDPAIALAAGALLFALGRL